LKLLAGHLDTLDARPTERDNERRAAFRQPPTTTG
jgi:hypothetical protein